MTEYIYLGGLDAVRIDRGSVWALELDGVTGPMTGFTYAVLSRAGVRHLWSTDLLDLHFQKLAAVPSKVPEAAPTASPKLELLKPTHKPCSVPGCDTHTKPSTYYCGSKYNNIEKLCRKHTALITQFKARRSKVTTQGSETWKAIKYSARPKAPAPKIKKLKAAKRCTLPGCEHTSVARSGLCPAHVHVLAGAVRQHARDGKYTPPNHTRRIIIAAHDDAYIGTAYSDVFENLKIRCLVAQGE